MNNEAMLKTSERNSLYTCRKMDWHNNNYIHDIVEFMANTTHEHKTIIVHCHFLQFTQFISFRRSGLGEEHQGPSQCLHLWLGLAQ